MAIDGPSTPIGHATVIWQASPAVSVAVKFNAVQYNRIDYIKFCTFLIVSNVPLIVPLMINNNVGCLCSHSRTVSTTKMKRSAHHSARCHCVIVSSHTVS